MLETHTARRTFKSLCEYSGVSPTLIRSIAGWSEKSMQSRYFKPDHDESIRILDSVFK